MASLENIFQLFRVNLKLASLNNILLSALLLTFTPIIFSINNLDAIWAARICEQYVAIIGIIVFVPVFSPEEDKGIRETVYAKPVAQAYVYIIRILTSVVIVAFFISLVVLVFVIYGGRFNETTLIAGTFASAFFLGALGMFVASKSGQLIAGYMVPVVYFIMDMMTKGKYTKDFFLFSLINNSFKEKYYLMGAALLLTVMSLLKPLKKS